MTHTYENVYLNITSTIAGVYEANGPIQKYFDKCYTNDLYFNEKSFEKAEVRFLKESILLSLKKYKKNVDLFVAGDLQNQISSSNYASRILDIPYLGVYSACATMGEGIIIASSFIESNIVNSCLVATSSHNMVAEKQFRNPTEYGAPKPKTSTFTTTGSGSAILSNKKSKIRVSSSTIGRTIDLGIKDVNHMGAVMAPAAADTINRHLINTKTNVEDYDLILTGDLGYYGKNILIEYMQKEYNIDLSANYNDCGLIIYDIKEQPVMAGASGPSSSALVTFSYIYNQMLEGKLNKVLIVPTGAIFSPTFVYQKESIPAIAHAFSLEVVK